MLYNIKRKAALEAAYQAWCMLMMQSYQLSICTCMTLQMVLSTRCRASTTTVRLHERRQGAVTGHVRALQLPRMLPWTPQGHHREHGMGMAGMQDTQHARPRLQGRQRLVGILLVGQAPHPQVGLEDVREVCQPTMLGDLWQLTILT